MKSMLLLLGILLTSGLCAGCGSSFGRTAQEREHRARSIRKSELGMAQDDLDVFLMRDRRSRLSRWH